MSGHNDSPRFSTAPFTEAAEAYAKFWWGLSSKMTEAAFAALPGSTPPEAMREMRAAMLKAMSDSAEQYMRTPQFQEILREWFANSIQFRGHMNEWLSRMHHELQGVSRQDIDAVIQAIGRLETRISEHLDSLSERLERLEKAETAAGGPPEEPKSTSPRTRKEKT